jgi:hypothetical protein
VTVNLDLANAARRVRALNERLPTEWRIDLAPEWCRLLDDLESAPESRAASMVAEWTAGVEERLSRRLFLIAPTGESEALWIGGTI